MQPPHATAKRLQWAVFWTASIGCLVGIDTWRNSKHDGTTVSELIRAITDTLLGKLAFLALLFIFARHILKVNKPVARQ